MDSLVRFFTSSSESCGYFSATMFKIIKEMLPPDVRVARDTQDLLVECCVGNWNLQSTHCIYIGC